MPTKGFPSLPRRQACRVTVRGGGCPAALAATRARDNGRSSAGRGRCPAPIAARPARSEGWAPRGHGGWGQP